MLMGAFTPQMPLRSNIAACSSDYVDHVAWRREPMLLRKKMNVNSSVVLGGVAATICVVDDDPSMLKALERLLLSAGLSARFFREPVAFLRDPPNHPVSGALTAIWIPPPTGLELLDELRPL